MTPTAPLTAPTHSAQSTTERPVLDFFKQRATKCDILVEKFDKHFAICQKIAIFDS